MYGDATLIPLEIHRGIIDRLIYKSQGLLLSVEK